MKNGIILLRWLAKLRGLGIIEFLANSIRVSGFQSLLKRITQPNAIYPNRNILCSFINTINKLN